MAHRLGSLVPIAPARAFRPGVGTNLGGGVWEDTFNSAAPPLGTTKFLILHFVGVILNPGDRLEVPLGNGDTDTFTSASGADFWTRPIKGGAVTIRFVDAGAGTGQATLTEHGRGEGIVNNGVDGTAGGNANGDVFLIDTPFVDPPHFTPLGVCPPGARHWANVGSLPAGVMRDAARSVGMFLEIGEGKISSCSAALIGPDLILTAAHCLEAGSVVPSGSFTLDFQTDATGNRPAAYNPKFHKIKRLVKAGWATAPTGGGLSPDAGFDYAILQIETPPGGLGVPPLSIRADLPPVGEEVFLIHHPRGATKKVSRKPDNPDCHIRTNTDGVLQFRGDVDNGSSGSPLFDLSGRIVGVNDWAGGCDPGTGAQAAATFLPDLSAPPPPATDVNVVLVFDRSGSMSAPGLSGGTKIQQARDAAALFVDLLRLDRTHRAGLVTFSTTASVATPLAPIAANRDTLIGPPPARDAGAIGGITPGEMTTIGGGLRIARQQLTASPSVNTQAIILLTDGLQNTPPMIADIEAELGTTRLCIIGFGTEGQLDGPLLTRLARNHGGIYTRAREGLELKKFFVLCFGNIFQTGIAADPFFVFPANTSSIIPLSLGVCDEDSITVVVSWKSASERLNLNLITPGGSTLTRGTPGVFSSSGATWEYFRLSLPFIGQREGSWQVQVTRATGGGEFPAPLPEEPFFVTVTAEGGPFMKALEPRRRYYTGDPINPQVVLRYPSGYQTHDADVSVEIESPLEGTGNLLAATGLGPSLVIGGDPLDARSSTLIAREQVLGGTLVQTTHNVHQLFDDGVRDGDGALEPNGVFGSVLKDVLRHEGHYGFHARASYGHECRGARETLWSTYVSIGIDPGRTTVTAEPAGTGPSGGARIRVTLTPRDRYGNYVGPGRSGSFDVTPQSGSSVVGGVSDNGDGSYTVDVEWDPGSSTPPGVVVTQPERPPVTIPVPIPEGLQRYVFSVKFLCGVQTDCECECSPVRPGTYGTEINIHNYLDVEVRVEKHVLPVVFAGAPLGREPRFATRRASDRIILPPHTATMDDCCRLAELLLGAPVTQPLPVTLGVVEIISNRPLSVSVVYTVTDHKTGMVSMDVEQIQGRRAR